MAGPRSEFESGARAALPIVPPNFAFAVVVGVATIRVSGSVLETVVLSPVLFAGAAQLAAVELYGGGAPLAVATATALLVNLRYIMYSAGLAPHLHRMPARWKALVSSVVVDFNFALSIPSFRSGDGVDARWHYLGATIPIWVSWGIGIAIGAVLGTDLPAWLSLEFAFPLMFLALLFSAIDGRYTALAAVVSAALAAAGAGLPMNLGLIVAALAGVAAGAAVEWRVGA